jgi:hypothetical protein
MRMNLIFVYTGMIAVGASALMAKRSCAQGEDSPGIVSDQTYFKMMSELGSGSMPENARSVATLDDLLKNREGLGGSSIFRKYMGLHSRNDLGLERGMACARALGVVSQLASGVSLGKVVPEANVSVLAVTSARVHLFASNYGSFSHPFNEEFRTAEERCEKNVQFTLQSSKDKGFEPIYFTVEDRRNPHLISQAEVSPRCNLPISVESASRTGGGPEAPDTLTLTVMNRALRKAADPVVRNGLRYLETPDGLTPAGFVLVGDVNQSCDGIVDQALKKRFANITRSHCLDGAYTIKGVTKKSELCTDSTTLAVESAPPQRGDGAPSSVGVTIFGQRLMPRR